MTATFIKQSECHEVSKETSNFKISGNLNIENGKVTRLELFFCKPDGVNIGNCTVYLRNNDLPSHTFNCDSGSLQGIQEEAAIILEEAKKLCV